MIKEKNKTMYQLIKIANQFIPNDKITKVEFHGNGLINKTFLLTTQSGQKYILQAISKNMGDIDKLMENVKNITDFLQEKNQKTLKLIHTQSNKPYIKVGEQSFRMYEYVDGVVYETINCPEDFKKAGIAFAEFSNALKDFDKEKLNITLPNFHNTQKRYDNFITSISTANQNRVSQAKPEIDFLISNNYFIDIINDMIKNGLPERVIHGDTKINNVIFNNDGTYVVDFDTIMKCYLCYDYGDAIRSGCNSAIESAPPDQVKFNLNNYASFTKGYLSVWKDISEVEQQSLFIGPMLVTYELALRFLTDYLQNDTYFSTSYPEQNLDRTKNQIALIVQMTKSLSYMNEIFYSNSQATQTTNKTKDYASAEK